MQAIKILNFFYKQNQTNVVIAQMWEEQNKTKQKIIHLLSQRNYNFAITKTTNRK